MSLLQLGFVGLSVLLVMMFAWATRSRRVLVVGLVWLALTGGVAWSGWLSDFSAVPPRIFFVLIPTFVMVLVIGLTGFGKKLAVLPWWFLVGYQAFRIPVELLIHKAVETGVAPEQMTWTGLNYDILTGVSALVLAPFASKLNHTAIAVWNTIGLGLLGWVVGVAVLSYPSPLQQLKPDNTWVAEFPYLWLPTVMVSSALLGHLAVYRKLRSEKRRALKRA
ncbi:MAG: hypothetical protein AAF593_05725 [Planctomycetota bacterium]